MENYDFERGVFEVPLIECDEVNDITLIYNKFTGKYESKYPIQKILVNLNHIHKIIFTSRDSWLRFKDDYLSAEKAMYKCNITENVVLMSGIVSRRKINILEIGCDDDYYVIASCVDVDKEEHMSDMNKLADDYNNVTRPYHYTQGDIECIDAIKASMTDEEFKGFLKGNSLKYLWRYENKNNPVEDLKKAKWYLDKLISIVESD